MRSWLAVFFAFWVVGCAARGPVTMPLWPGTPPDALRDAASETRERSTTLVAGRPWVALHDVSRPRMTVYPAKGKNTGAAIVVFPGGGYQVLAIDLEGTEVCDWFASRGVTCVVLEYRVPNSGMHWDPSCSCQLAPKAPTALEDAQRAMGLLRLHAAEWHVDPRRIGVLGFSAGGHLAADLSTHFERRAYARLDAADDQSCRPDFAVVLYPGHLWIDETKLELNPDIRVTHATPPTFLLQAKDDPVDDVKNSLVYDAALVKAGVPVEMHLFEHGGHAFGLRRTRMPITDWPRLVSAWLAGLGVTP